MRSSMATNAQRTWFIDSSSLKMDYGDLRESIRINRHLPPIIFANIGTTMTGAIDNLDNIRSILNEYVGVNDTTITGSRSAFAPLMLWYGLRKHGEQGLKNMVTHSLDLADYAISQFKKHNIHAWRNPNSPIVIFARPSEAIAQRWSLALEEDDHGFIIINVDEYDKALRALRDAGYQPVTEDAIVIRVTDEPGALARVANRFQEAHINLRSLHIIRRCKNINHVSLVSDNNEAAKNLVEDLLVK